MTIKQKILQRNHTLFHGPSWIFIQHQITNQAARFLISLYDPTAEGGNASACMPSL